MLSYLKLSIAALLPVIAAVCVFFLDKHTSYSKLNKHIKQIICGVIFGGLAVLGTEWGIPINGAQVNCRDAAVIIAGLMFGPEAGLIAGVIGGVERWIAVAWGVGSFTRAACSVSTICAGIYAALLRKFMFENKRPSWMISFAIGVVIEVFHLTMVFVTNMNTPTQAINVVMACTAPMVIANGLSVMLAALALAIASKERLILNQEQVKLSQTIQRWLLLVVSFAFIITSFFIIRLQSTIAQNQTETMLSIALSDVSSEINDASDKNLLEVTGKVINDLSDNTLNELSEKYNVAEINIVGSTGIITNSTNPDFIGYYMGSGAQSAAFLCMLNGEESFVQSYGPITYDENISRKYAALPLQNGFIQVGYDTEQFQTEVNKIITRTASHRHVGEEGLIVILDSDYNIVSRPENDSKPYFFNFANVVKDGSTFTIRLNAVEHYAKCTEVEGYTIVSFLPVTEALRMRNTSLYVNTFLEIMVFALVFAMVYQLIKRLVVDKIDTINLSLSKIIAGNLDEKVNVLTNQEFTSLSTDINSTVSALKQYIAEAEARIDKELEFAKAIQASAVPSVFNNSERYDIFASMDTAKEVGGDFYDFYQTDNDTLNFLVADVSGKGIPAAMFMMRAKTELRSLTESGEAINNVFTKGNNALCDGNDAGMFVTAWQGRLDLNTGALQFVNAGHNPPLVYRNGKFEYLRSKAGFILAGMDGIPYKTQEIQLEKGDIVFLYTDGVTEATNINNELYGEDRLLEALNSRLFDTMEDMCKFIKEQVDAFTGEADQFDDITMMGLRYGEIKRAKTMVFDNAETEDIEKVTDFIEAILEENECPLPAVMQINVAVDEIFSNIVKHGYHGGKGPVWISVLADKEKHTVTINFEDCGRQYNPLKREDPDVTLTAEEREIGGLGIFLVKKTMDDFTYECVNGKNLLTIRKNW